MLVLPTPKKYFLTAGAAEGHSELNAFDNALLKARVGNVNLIKVSSILPPEAVFDAELVIPFGSLVPIAYACIISEHPGEIISAAVATGISEDSFGVIMEYSCHGSKDQAEAAVIKMVEEAFATRGMNLREIKLAAVEHTVTKIGCAFAAVPLWY